MNLSGTAKRALFGNARGCLRSNAYRTACRHADDPSTDNISNQLLFKNPGCCRKSRNGQCGLSKQTENTQKAEGLAWRVSVCSGYAAGYGRDLPRSRRPDKPTGSHWTISGTTDLALLLGQTLCEGVCVWGRIWLPFNGPLLFRHPPLLLVRTFTSFVVVPASPGNDVHSHPQTDSSSAHPLAESNHGQHHI